MRKILKILLFAIIGVAFIGTFIWLWKKSKPKEVVYEIVEVTQETIENTSVATGEVAPRDEVLIKPQIPGIISSVLKEAGDYVQEGDIIATVKVVPEMVDLNTSESRVNVAKINLNRIQTEYERQQMLFNKGVIAREEMDQSEADYKKALEELENAKDNYDIVRTGMSSKTAQYSNTQIRSTITGMILDVPVKVGNSVIQSNTFNEGTTIAIVADMNDLIFVGDLDETEVGRVHTGMPIKLSIGALEDFSFDAELEYISPKGKEESGATLFEIKAAANIPDSIPIRSGYSANAEIVLARVDDALCVPENTIEFTGDSTYVYVLSSEKDVKQEFEKRVIQIGLSNGIKVEVKKGLTLGEKVRSNETFDSKKIKTKDKPSR